jgi:hypothetical protein
VSCAVLNCVISSPVLETPIENAHYYLYADCKTPDCKSRLWFAHFEAPDLRHFIKDYPDEWFPVRVPCGTCGQVHSYYVKDIQTQSSHTPHHPPDWKPILPDPPVKPQDMN